MRSTHTKRVDISVNVECKQVMCGCGHRRWATPVCDACVVGNAAGWQHRFVMHALLATQPDGNTDVRTEHPGMEACMGIVLAATASGPLTCHGDRTGAAAGTARRAFLRCTCAHKYALHERTRSTAQRGVR